MSDSAQGPDWWLASDGKWYPPAAPLAGHAPAPGGPVPPGAVPGMAMQQPVVIVQKKSSATAIIIAVVVVLLIIPVMAVVAILAVTLLGKSASSKFSSVGSTISVVEWPVTPTFLDLG